jgi:hypothetical protein
MAGSLGDGTDRFRRNLMSMRKVLSIVKTTIAAIAVFGCALLAVPAMSATAGASPTLFRTQGTPASGGPGATVSYTYTWDYADCASNSSDPGSLTIVLAWDDPATTPVGFAPVTVNQGQNVCQGVVTGQVPANATAGDHFPSASLKEPSSRGNTIVKNSNTGQVSQGQQFTVALPPTATPVPTPSPTSTDTPLPTDTPTALTTPTPTATGSASNAAPLATNNTGTSGPSKALLVGIGLVVLIAAATAATVLVRRRRARAAESDPFEFLR